MRGTHRRAIWRRAPEPIHPRAMADDEVVAFAHMIGDGSCVKNQPIGYPSIDEMNLSAEVVWWWQSVVVAEAMQE